MYLKSNKLVAAYYISLLIIGVWTLWGIWEWRDLSNGDTSYYFRGAQQWADSGSFSGAGWMTFSPLYMNFFGWFVRVWEDAWQAMIAHRIAVVLFASLGTFMVARKVLPGVWAWLAAVWWVVLPINWNAYFEVHVFGFGLLMWAAAWIGASNRWGRSFGIILFGTNAVLVRNEYLPGVFLLILWALFAAWKRGAVYEFLKESRAIGVTTILTALTVVWMYSGNPQQLNFQELLTGFKARQRVNLQQVYPFGYQQRNTDFKGDPWTQGSALMVRDFGRKDPTLGEALSANPKAFFEHIKWNCLLIPSGIQFGMFSRYAGKTTPDFGAMKGGSTAASYLFGLVCSVLAAASILLFRKPKIRVILSRYLRPSRGTIAALLCMMPSVFLAIATQRPRPSYIFPLSFALMLTSLLALRLLVGYYFQRRPNLRSLSRIIVIIFGLSLTLTIPATGRPTKNFMPIADDYHRLLPYRNRLSLESAPFCTDAVWGDELANYLSRGNSKRIPFVPLEPMLKTGLAQSLEAKGVKTIYLSPKILMRTEVHEWRNLAPNVGWIKLAVSQNSESEWELWIKG